MKRLLAVAPLFGLTLLGGCAARQQPMEMPPPGAPEQQMGAYPGAPPQPMGAYPGVPSQPMGAYPGGAPPQMGMPPGGPPPQVVEQVAERVIAHYQTSSCQTLAQERSHPSAQRAEMVQRAAQVLREDPQVRMEFLNRVAAPVANKLFECGLIP
ncbi:MAG TPA: hypothetical protein VMW56_10605 [Candidatus Margulisiibacteriota bacterium]|nr:hypothetical protein [Candidatus Margulisiibacteriota bacterium]